MLGQSILFFKLSMYIFFTSYLQILSFQYVALIRFDAKGYECDCIERTGSLKSGVIGLSSALFIQA